MSHLAKEILGMIEKAVLYPVMVVGGVLLVVAIGLMIMAVLVPPIVFVFEGSLRPIDEVAAKSMLIFGRAALVGIAGGAMFGVAIARLERMG